MLRYAWIITGYCPKTAIAGVLQFGVRVGDTALRDMTGERGRRMETGV